MSAAEEAPVAEEDTSAAVASAEALLVSGDTSQQVEGARLVEKLALDPRCVFTFTLSRPVF
jgi:hypothetical protein|tara:strand:+ start:2168 stop:2350 length:183 start_codon:yes stop_codon:yes gene_type:complete